MSLIGLGTSDALGSGDLSSILPFLLVLQLSMCRHMTTRFKIAFQYLIGYFCAELRNLVLLNLLPSG